MQSEKTKLFIEKARAKHGDRYDYSLVEYVRSKDKVKIICKEHGVFEQGAGRHTSARGCAACGKDQTNRRNAASHEQAKKSFVSRSEKIHGGKYDYSKSVYTAVSSKLTITCPEHGDFTQTPTHHLSGKGCALCAGNVTLGKAGFIKKSVSAHGNKYDYSHVKYENNGGKVSINCPDHGIFKQKAEHHMAGSGCPKCAGLHRKNTDDFIGDARAVHGERYDYSQSEYLGSKINLKIICEEHGVFEQSPNSHLRGSGCGSCSYDRNQETFLYVISNNSGESKIGITIDVKRRLNDLVRATPFGIRLIKTWPAPTFEAAFLIEQEAHRLLASRASGHRGFDGASEWFATDSRYASELLNSLVVEAQFLMV